MPHEPLSILIDTDIGDDVDDAFALALALRLPQLRVCGVTTVCGPRTRRALLARRILTDAGSPALPVGLGAERRVDGHPLPDRFSHAPLIEGAQLGEDQPAAVELILRCSHQHAPLTILGLGPLTNIAAALDRDPSLAQRTRLIAVGGVLGLPYPDWNLRCDPHAARLVFASGMPIMLVGLHLTIRCKLWPAQLRRLLNSQTALARTLGNCVFAWRTWKRRMPILHDVLAVAAAADPSIVTTEPRHVRLIGNGSTWMTRRGPSNAEVALTADIGRFDELLRLFLLDDTLVECRPSWRERFVHQLA